MRWLPLCCAILLTGAACAVGVPAATTSAERAEITSVELVASADADGDGHVSAGELVVTANTTCPGCYDSDTLLEDPELEPVITLTSEDGTTVTIDADPTANYTVRRYLTTLTDTVERDTASITVTLYDRDPVGRERIDATTFETAVESPAADRDPNATSAEPSQGLPHPGTTRETDHFTFVYGGLDRCGWTCRDAVGTVSTGENTTATDVSVHVRLRAGKTVFWSGSERVGNLSANESYTTTQHIGVGYAAVRAVERADGRLALVVEVRSDAWREVVAFERDVL